MNGQRGAPSTAAMDLTLQGVTKQHLLAQLPAALVHESFFGTYQISPWTVIELWRGERRATAWLVPASRDLLDHADGQPWCSTAWISKNLASSLDLAFDTPEQVRVVMRSQYMRVQPARIDNYIESDRVVASPELVKAFGTRLLASSGSRIAVLRAVRRDARKQNAGSVRINYNTRRLLGIAPDPVTNRESIQISRYMPAISPHGRKAEIGRWIVWSLSLPILLLEILGRVALRAPNVLLASEESYTSDDPHGVARVSEEAAELLGISSGDSIYVFWGSRYLKIRALTFKTEAPPVSQKQRIVDWTPSVRPPRADSESRIALPGKVRATIGAPRNAIVRVRRSVLSVLRRRLIALALPVAAVGVGAAALSPPWYLTAGLVVAVFVLTLAGDRIPRKPWMH